jgi:putative PIN family toxin of toxin-antitoxin system
VVAKPPGTVAPRVVFDTGVVVSALVFKGGALDWLRDAWREGRVVPLVSRATADELIRVLAYPKFRLSEADREELLGEFLPYAEPVNARPPKSGLPRCRDPEDRMFLELAAAAHADALVTGDDDLLALADAFTIPIVAPAAWRRSQG